MRRGTYAFLALAVVGSTLPTLFSPRSTEAMPTFAQAYGVKCSVCHTMVPLLNSYGRYIQRSGYSSLDRQVLDRALPFWIGESVNYDSSTGAGTGTPRYSFGNLALHATGYLAPDVTFHAQQFITDGDQAGGVDTLWVTYNNLLHRDGHLFVGKIENPAPSPYSQTFDIDGPSASATLVGEHDWGATYDNRWGTKLAYVKKSFDLEAGYLLSGEDLSGASDFGPGDKTFQWKAAYAQADRPVEAGLFGSIGSIPVSTGLDRYNSIGAYVQVDPKTNGVPGVLAIDQLENDSNPGADANTGIALPVTSSHGISLELYEPLFKGDAVIGARHDISYDGFRTVTVGNTLNLGLNIPRFPYAHAYFETTLGGSSSLAGASNGPTWKGMLWLTLPLRKAP